MLHGKVIIPLSSWAWPPFDSLCLAARSLGLGAREGFPFSLWPSHITEVKHLSCVTLSCQESHRINGIPEPTALDPSLSVDQIPTIPSDVAIYLVVYFLYKYQRFNLESAAFSSRKG